MLTISGKKLSLHAHDGDYASEHSIKCQAVDFAKWTVKLYLIHIPERYEVLAVVAESSGM
jgi:hypothetical protein